MIPDQGIYPMAPRVFETTVEYMDWLKNEHAPALGIDADNAPIIGITLQKSHINTKDDAHYVSLVMELESKGALVVPTCARHPPRARPPPGDASPPPTPSPPPRAVLSLTRPFQPRRYTGALDFSVCITDYFTSAASPSSTR